MAQFFHRKCNKGIIACTPLTLTVMTMELSGGVAKGALLDIKVIGKDGNLRKLDESSEVNIQWFCTTCHENVQEDEVLSFCFGCGGKHPLSEMFSTHYTSPVNRECYAKYRAEHEEELLPEKPKSWSMLDVIHSLIIKI